MDAPSHDESIAHCLAKVAELVACDAPDRRAILQLGYNLGRLSELTGAGREPFWDRWKDPVSRWDRPALQDLARRLAAERLRSQNPPPGPLIRS